MGFLPLEKNERGREKWRHFSEKNKVLWDLAIDRDVNHRELTFKINTDSCPRWNPRVQYWSLIHSDFLRSESPGVPTSSLEDPLGSLYVLSTLSAPVLKSAGCPHLSTARPHVAGFALDLMFMHGLPRTGPDLVLTVGWSSCYLFAWFKCLFITRINFWDSFEFWKYWVFKKKKKNEFELIIFPQCATYQLQPETRRLEWSFWI